MNLNRIYIAAILLLIALTNTCKVGAQSIEQCLVKADSLSKLEDWEKAFLLYDRIWFYQDTMYQKKIFTSYSKSAFYTHRYSSFLSIISSSKNGPEPTLGSDLKVMEVLTLFNSENWAECIASIEEYLEEENDDLKLNLYFFKCLCHVKLNQKELVESYLPVLKSYASPQKQQELDSIWNAYKKSNPYALKNIQLLSLLMPGLGQWHQKEYAQGVNAFTLNAALLAAFGFTVRAYNWPQAILFWAYYVPHYYVGNAKSAKELAIKNNKKMEDTFFEAFKNWNPK